MRTAVYIVLLVTLYTSTANAWWNSNGGGNEQQSGQGFGRQSRIIEVVGAGSVQVQPDRATIRFQLEDTKGTASEALGVVSKSAECALKSLTQNYGIGEQQIRTNSFDLQPQVDYIAVYDDNGRFIRNDSQNRGFRASISYEFEVNDLSQVSKILDHLSSKPGAQLRINGVDFVVSNRDKQFLQAQKLAIQNAREQAEALAEAAGERLGRVLKISTSNQDHPSTVFYAKYGAAEGLPLPGGSQTVSASVSVTYKIRCHHDKEDKGGDGEWEGQQNDSSN